MRRLLAASLSLCLAPALCAQENVMLVLDASGSMWGQIDGRSKVEIARETVAGLLREWKAENQLGLTAYGHRRRGDCEDIEVLIPVGPLDAEAYLRRVNGLNALGMTPLSAAVIKAAEALRHTEQKATVILVSDGEETCRLDPCEVGRSLAQAGIDFTAHVIGFDVADPAHQAQLRCLAENTGGRYLNASDAEGLAVALGSVVAMSTEPALPPAQARLMPPEQISVATTIEVRWEGPGDAGDYIAFYDLRGERPLELHYGWVRRSEDEAADPSRPVQVRSPGEPGSYALRYVSPRRKDSTLAEVVVPVAEAAARIEGPREAFTGTRIEVTAVGPVDGGHWIGFAPAGSDPGAYRDYVRPQQGTERYTLRAPSEAGDYELRYVLDESAAVAASQPIRVLPIQVRLEGPAEVAAGSAFAIRWEAPFAPESWVSIVPAGSPDGTYLSYAYHAEGQQEYELTAPNEAGDYELRHVLPGDVVVARRPIRVVGN